MKFRPCIDIHEGKVKQIVGSSLRDNQGASENFVSDKSPAYYADLYYKDGLTGGHVILLGPGNESAAREAVGRHPGNLHIGGGVTPANARQWLQAGAGKVIITSYLFRDNELDMRRVEEISSLVGPEHLVIDLSCRPVDGVYHVAANRWQTTCRQTVDAASLSLLAQFCSEFLIHAVQAEGKQAGIDAGLVRLLAEHSPIPAVYAGGIRSMEDIRLIGEIGQNRIDYTVGSALDIFGGRGVRYRDLLGK